VYYQSNYISDSVPSHQNSQNNFLSVYQVLASMSFYNILERNAFSAVRLASGGVGQCTAKQKFCKKSKLIVINFSRTCTSTNVHTYQCIHHTTTFLVYILFLLSVIKSWAWTQKCLVNHPDSEYFFHSGLTHLF
jgi:hypothetical protein